MRIKAEQFVTGSGRRVLTDDGQQGMGGKVNVGSSTEVMQGRVAAAIYENCSPLDNRQLDEIIEWVSLYKREWGELRGMSSEAGKELATALDLLGVNSNVPLHVKHILITQIRNVAAYLKNAGVERQCDDALQSIRAAIQASH